MAATTRKVSRLSAGALALLLVCAGSSFAQTPGKNVITIRGQPQAVYYYPAAGLKSGRKVLFAPGDGGWRGWAVTVAQQMAAWGYDVYGLDTKTYLSGLTGCPRLRESDVMSDFREIARWMTQGSGGRIILVGWSAGAGLGVLAAAGDPGRRSFAGLVTFGLGDENALGWSWRDSLTYLTKAKPNEPTFRAMEYIGRVPALLMIQSSRDEYLSPDEAKNLYAAARGQKRLAVIEAADHQFGGNVAGFYQTLRDGLQELL